MTTNREWMDRVDKLTAELEEWRQNRRHSAEALRNVAQLTAERAALQAKLDAQLALHEQGRAENERLRAELRIANPFHRNEIAARNEMRAQLRELREAAEAVTREYLGDAFKGAQYDVTDSIAYVDNAALKTLRAVLAKVSP